MFRRPYIVILLLLLNYGCDGGKGVHHLVGSTMGTRWHLTYHTLEDGFILQPEDIRLLIEDRLFELNIILSNYISDSEVSRLNKSPVGKPIDVSNELLSVLIEAQKIKFLTDGIYDISVSPLVDLWGFGPSSSSFDFPSEDEIFNTKSYVGMNELNIDDKNQVVVKTEERSFDLSSLGKGYAVDEIVKDLKVIGIENFLFEIGGEIFASGLSPKGRPWRVAVRSPSFNSSDVSLILSVSEAAIATSGDYQNFFEYQEIRYSHFINPHTGYPVSREVVSATVISDTTMKADALATALLLLGSNQAMKLAEERDLAVYLLRKDGGDYIELKSAKLSNYIKK